MSQTQVNLTAEQRVTKAMEALKVFELHMAGLRQDEKDLLQKTIKEAEDSKIKEVFSTIMQLYDRKAGS